MSIEDTITEAVRTAIAPLVSENRRLAAAVEQLRRALPAQLVTVPQAAKALGVHEATVRRRIADGSLPVRRVGKSVRIDLSAITRAPSDGEVLRLASDSRST